MSAAVMNLSAMPFSGRNSLLYFFLKQAFIFNKGLLSSGRKFSGLDSRIFSNREIQQSVFRGFSLSGFTVFSVGQVRPVRHVRQSP